MKQTFSIMYCTQGVKNTKVTIGILDYASPWEQGTGHLSIDEQEICANFKVDRRRNQFLAGRYIAKECVLKENTHLSPAMINIVNGAWGFPLIHTERLCRCTVSIAHTDNFAAALFYADNTHPAGIDIEEIREEQVPSLQGFISGEEQTLITSSQLPYNETLHMMWAAKEAAGKALKVGFTIPEDVYNVSSLICEESIYYFYFGKLSMLKAIGWYTDNFAICIAFPSMWNVERIIKGSK